MTERAAQRLPKPVDVLELDVNRAEDLEALTEPLRERWGGIDGALHAIAFAPQDALGGKFMTAPADSAAQAFTTSAFSLKALAAALQPLMERGGSDRRARLRRHASPGRSMTGWASPRPRWSPSTRYLARDLGPDGIRCNLVSAGPLGTVAAQGIPGFEQLADLWRRRPRSAGTSPIRRRSPGRCAGCCRTTRGRSAARSCTSTAVFTPSARRPVRRSRRSAEQVLSAPRSSGATRARPRRRDALDAA